MVAVVRSGLEEAAVAEVVGFEAVVAFFAFSVFFFATSNDEASSAQHVSSTSTTSSGLQTRMASGLDGLVCQSKEALREQQRAELDE